MADALVRAANQSGGKDNITVVLFRLEGDEGDAAAAADETIPGTVSADEVRAAAAPQPPPPPAQPTHDATVIRPPAPRPAPARRRQRVRVGAVARVLVSLVLVAGVVAGLYALSRQVYFVATNDGGLVTLYRGVPYELPLGLDLYEEEYASGVPARAIPPARRRVVLDHSWRSKEDAVDLVRALERGRLDPGGSGS
jgi:PPM family protein phosphatase